MVWPGKVSNHCNTAIISDDIEIVNIFFYDVSNISDSHKCNIY